MNLSEWQDAVTAAIRRIEYPNLVKLLEKRNIDFGHVSDEEAFGKHFTMQLQGPAYFGNVEVMKFLIDAGCYVDQRFDTKQVSCIVMFCI